MLNLGDIIKVEVPRGGPNPEQISLDRLDKPGAQKQRFQRRRVAACCRWRSTAAETIVGSRSGRRKNGSQLQRRFDSAKGE